MEMCLRENQPIPEAIKNRPDLVLGLDLYYSAFMSLTDSRPIGMKVGPIPWNVIQYYCERRGFTEDQTEAAHHHLRRMDEAYLKHLEK